MGINYKEDINEEKNILIPEKKENFDEIEIKTIKYGKNFTRKITIY